MKDDTSVIRVSKDLDNQIKKMAFMYGISRIEASDKLAKEFKKKTTYKELFNL